MEIGKNYLSYIKNNEKLPLLQYMEIGKNYLHGNTLTFVKNVQGNKEKLRLTELEVQYIKKG
jgi:hypothetical protein